MKKQWLRLALAGLVALCVAACSGSDDGPPPETPKPTAVIRASAQAVGTDNTATVQTSLGASVTLDASGSSAGSGSIASTAWTVTARPSGSTAAIIDASSAQARFTPDVVGSYTLQMQVADTAGGTAKTTVTIAVGATPATPNVVSAVSFSGPSTTAPVLGTAVGTPVTLDASASSDPAGGTLTLSWDITRKPAGSAAVLTVTGQRAAFTPDLVGDYEVRVRGTAAAGNWAESVHVYSVNDGAPRVLVSGSVTAPTAQGATLNAAVGNVVALQGYAVVCCAGATDSSWTFLSRPSNSSISQLTPNGNNAVRFVPDASGSYVVQYSARVSGGSLAFYTVTVTVAPSPQVVVSASASPVASATAPSFLAAPGQPVTLRSGGSYDPSGGTLGYDWRIQARPTMSSATLATPSAADTEFTPDRVGRYDIELTVNTSTGLRAVQALVLMVGTTVPTAVVERANVSVVTGQPARVSAASSSTASGNTLSYSWAIDARPAGSTATIANASAATLEFSPDVAGTYTATVTVSDGPLSAVAPVTIVALSPSAGVMPLGYTPGVSRYNVATGKAIVASSAPDALHVVDPVALTDVSIALPAPAKMLSVSPSGRWAAVMHDNSASVVDLTNRVVTSSFFLQGPKTDLVMLDTGVVVLAGVAVLSNFSNQYGYLVIDGANGTTLQTLVNGTISQFGTFRVLHSPLTNRLIAVSDCCTSNGGQITTINPTTSLLTHASSGIQGGISTQNAPVWLTGDEAFIVNSFATLYRAGDFANVGSLLTSSTSGTGRLFAFSQSAAAAEAVALEVPNSVCCDFSTRYPSVLKRWTGSLYFASADLSLPRISGEQSYGLAVFHAADNRRLVLVQTGSDRSAALGLRYYLVLR